jgi:hypothetical protein
VACPFFFPVSIMVSDAFVIAPRLPLGEFFVGECRAQAEAIAPSAEVMRSSCSNGYGRGFCDRFPSEAAVDAVRFHITEPAPELLRIQFVLEKSCWPASHGFLEYSRADRRFLTSHSDAIVQRQAEVFVGSFESRVRSGGEAGPSFA